MTDSLRVACVQNCADLDVERNLEVLARLIADAAGQGAELVTLPEYGSCLGRIDGRLAVGAEPEEEHKALRRLRTIAAEHGIWLLIGSIGVTAGDGRVLNRSILVDRQGRIGARYDKIHMFDVDLDGGESYRESDVVAPGERAVIASLPQARLGLSVCYDVRFPHLYRTLAQAGADILSVPAAFVRKTGRAHWHVLLRARAIETGCFVVAPSQHGEAADGSLQRYGHSLIVAPWGEVLADGGEEEAVVVADLDLRLVAKARAMVPALSHDRPFTLEPVGEAAVTSEAA